MAQTRKKRRKKHRGTQGGRIDTRRRARPRSRAEAKAQARTRRTNTGSRADNPPSWRGAIIRAVGAALVFGAIVLVFFKQPVGGVIGLTAFMLVIYIPAGYYIDLAMWRRRERARIRSREGE